MKTQIKRRISAIAVALVLVVVAAVFAVEAAQPNPVFTVNGASQLRPGDEVTVSVTVNDNKGFCAGEFILGYDSAALTPVAIQGGEAVSEYFVGNENYANGKVYFTVINDSLMKDSGTVAEVTFKVKDSVVLYSGKLTLTVPTLVSDVALGYGYFPIKSTTSAGEIHAAKQVFVPDANNPAVNEELAVKADSNGYVLVGSTYANLVQSEIAKNFGALKAEFFAANGAALASQTLLTTGCKIKLTDSNGKVNNVVMSVKGDVDGNCTMDANDAFLVGMYQNGLLSAEDLGSAYENAADLNGDGKVDGADFDAAVNAPLK